MEAENRLTLPQETINEIFFKEEARRLDLIYPDPTDPDTYRCLRERLYTAKMLLAHLTLPWEHLSPVMFRSLALYMKRPRELAATPKSYHHAALLMDCMSYLSQQGALVNHMVSYFDYQIKELDRLLEQSDTSVK